MDDPFPFNILPGLFLYLSLFACFLFCFVVVAFVPLQCIVRFTFCRDWDLGDEPVGGFCLYLCLFFVCFCLLHLLHWKDYLQSGLGDEPVGGLENVCRVQVVMVSIAKPMRSFYLYINYFVFLIFSNFIFRILIYLQFFSY